MTSCVSPGNTQITFGGKLAFERLLGEIRARASGLGKPLSDQCFAFAVVV
jgi:hypothetical protein